MRPLVFAANWKMYLGPRDARDYLATFRHAYGPIPGRQVWFFPPAVSLEAVAAGLEHRVDLLAGAQDIYWEPKGAFTGEVSIAMLEDYCRYVIIGHSERRQFFGETDETVNRKLKAVLASTLDPIVCVGELLDERRSGRTEDVLARQVNGGLQGIDLTERVTVAYEPVWAIGTGETATPEMAQEACAFIRGLLQSLCGNVASRIRIQYGGSVNAENAAELLAQPDIDGALVGGASLKADQFLAIVAAARK